MRAGAARRQETYESRVKLAAITVTLAQLENDDFKLAKPLMRHVTSALKARDTHLACDYSTPTRHITIHH
jgi:hypothetical protein